MPSTDIRLRFALPALFACLAWACAEDPSPPPLQPVPCEPPNRTLTPFTQPTRPADYHPSFSLDTFATTLPILVIDTYGADIVDEPKITAILEVFDASNPAALNRLSHPPTQRARIGIEIRGYSSQSAPKRQFSLAFHDANGKDQPRPFVGLPSAADWVLSATHSDLTMIRNPLTYTLAAALPRWSPRTRHVEVFLNTSGASLSPADYLGLFVITERVQRDPNRVDLPRVDSTLPPDANAYLFEFTQRENIWIHAPWFCGPYSGIKLTFVYPKTPNVQQKDYAQQRFTLLEEALFAHRCQDFARAVDLDVFADYHLFNELVLNVDAFRRSLFIQAHPNAPLLLWPLWDFDLAYRENHPGELTTWTTAMRVWAHHALHCATYRRVLLQRWTDLRQGPLATATIDHTIDTLASAIRPAALRNIERWPTALAENGYTPTTPADLAFDTEIEALRTFLHTRAAWMDANLPAIEPSPYTGW